MIKLLSLLVERKLKTPPAFHAGQILTNNLGEKVFKVLEVVPDYKTAVENKEFFDKKYENDFIHLPPKDQFFGNLGPNAENDYWYLMTFYHQDDTTWWENEGFIKFRLKGYHQT